LAAGDPRALRVPPARPGEEVFAYVADTPNQAESPAPYLADWHLTGEEPYGRGAGARFRVKAPGNRFNWADATLIELQPPYRIVEAGRTGKFNRVRTVTTYTMKPGPGHGTRVELTSGNEKVTLADRQIEEISAL